MRLLTTDNQSKQIKYKMARLQNRWAIVRMSLAIDGHVGVARYSIKSKLYRLNLQLSLSAFINAWKGECEHAVFFYCICLFNVYFMWQVNFS